MMATIPEDESCSPVPHVTFVKVPEKWMLNNPQMRGRTPKPPAAAGKKKTNEEEAAAAAKEEGGDIIKKPTKTELELEAWFRKRGVAVAPQRQFVNVEALYELFRSDRGVDASAAEGDSALRLSEITLHVFRSCSGKVLNAMFPNQLTRRNGKLSITCDAIPAAPENWPPKRTNRKEMKLAKFGPKDPNRSRNVTANEGPTFMRYVNEMLKLACSPELVRLKVFPDAKELTESLAVNNAIRTHLAEEFAPGDERVTLIAVGDGNTPRTAALCAFLTKWQCVAVDPEMIPWEKWRVSRNIVEGMEWSTCATAGDSGGGDDDGGGGGSELNGWGGVRRLQAHRRKMQEMIVDCDRALLVLVHAHISLKVGGGGPRLLPYCIHTTSYKHKYHK